jgi:hypothetical protein
MSSYVFENLDKDWDYDTLSGNPIISMEDVENHPENPNITWGFIEDNPHFNWCYGLISVNKHIGCDSEPYILK